MGTYQEKEYYDEVYKNSEFYKVSYKDSIYFLLWKKVVFNLLWKYRDKKILDLGCGPGQFAEFLFDCNFKHYIGIDFSEEAIAQAESKKLEGFQFYCLDITQFPETPADILLCFETFEHVKDESGIFKNNHGKEIIFTVPSFDDPAHVRFFKNGGEVFNRYLQWIDIHYLEKFDRWFICKGTVL